MDKQIAIVLMLFPLLAFGIAGAAELRSGGTAVAIIRNLIPSILGIVDFWLLWYPDAAFPWTVESSSIISRVMVIVSAAIACSGVFITYSRRSSSRWVACGGLMLAVMWMYNRVVT